VCGLQGRVTGAALGSPGERRLSSDLLRRTDRKASSAGKREHARHTKSQTHPQGTGIGL